MNRFRQIFPNRHTILPVIHVEELAQAQRNVEIAHRSGCDGVFLINHYIAYQELLQIHQAVYDVYPDWWIGVNCLDLAPQEIFQQISPKRCRCLGRFGND